MILPSFITTFVLTFPFPVLYPEPSPSNEPSARSPFLIFSSRAFSSLLCGFSPGFSSLPGLGCGFSPGFSSLPGPGCGFSPGFSSLPGSGCGCGSGGRDGFGFGISGILLEELSIALLIASFTAFIIPTLE